MVRAAGRGRRARALPPPAAATGATAPAAAAAGPPGQLPGTGAGTGTGTGAGEEGEMAARRAAATRARGGGEGARAAELNFLRRRRSVHALQEHRMSGRVMVMEDGRPRESKGGEHGVDELRALLLSAVTFDKKWRDQFPRLVTKGLCAPVICLLKSLEPGSFQPDFAAPAASQLCPIRATINGTQVRVIF
jgi:hypothetical protein